MSNLETNILATHLSNEAHLFYSFHVFTLHKYIYSKTKEMKDLKSLIDKTESKFQGPKVKSRRNWTLAGCQWKTVGLSCSNSSFYQVGLEVSL